MTAPHAWETEEIDGGPVGVGVFWRCSTCGAAGGPKDWWPDEPERRWRPFLAGEGVELDDDCVASQAIIWGHVTERLERLAALDPPGRLTVKYAPTLKSVLLRSPAVSDLTPFVHALDVATRDLKARPKDHGATKLAGVCEDLAKAGFWDARSTWRG